MTREVQEMFEWYVVGVNLKERRYKELERVWAYKPNECFVLVSRYILIKKVEKDGRRSGC